MNRDSSGAVIIPPIMGAAIRLMTSEPCTGSPEYWQQTRNDHRHGHGFRPDTQYGTMIEGFIKGLPV